MEKRIRVAAAVAAISLLLILLVDFSISIWPMEVGEDTWRIGAYSAAANSVLLGMVAALLLLWVSVSGQSTSTSRILAILFSLVAVIFLVGLPLFGLDVLQVRSQRQPNADNTFMRLLLSTGAKGGLGGIVFGVFGWVAFSAGREASRARQAAAAEPRRNPPALVTARGDTDGEAEPADSVDR